MSGEQAWHVGEEARSPASEAGVERPGSEGRNGIRGVRGDRMKLDHIS